MSADALARLQQLLGDALVAADPVAHWRQHLAQFELDEDGLRVAALLVAKLRFERLRSASSEAVERFAVDPEAFTALFGDYHREVPSPALDPWREAACFARWLDDRERAT